MIKLIFTINNETFYIVIDNRYIWYSDRKWGRAIRLIPKDEDFINKIKLSRNKYPHVLINLFELTEEEKKEYENANSDKEIAKICIKDVRSKGGKLIKIE